MTDMEQRNSQILSAAVVAVLMTAVGVPVARAQTAPAATATPAPDTSEMSTNSLR